MKNMKDKRNRVGAGSFEGQDVVSLAERNKILQEAIWAFSKKTIAGGSTIM
jgi:hypothetical protein